MPSSCFECIKIMPRQIKYISFCRMRCFHLVQPYSMRLQMMRQLQLPVVVLELQQLVQLELYQFQECTTAFLGFLSFRRSHFVLLRTIGFQDQTQNIYIPICRKFREYKHHVMEYFRIILYQHMFEDNIKSLPHTKYSFESHCSSRLSVQQIFYRPSSSSQTN